MEVAHLEEVLVQLLARDGHQLWKRHLVADLRHLTAQKGGHGLIGVQDFGMWAYGDEACVVVYRYHGHHNGLGCSYSRLHAHDQFNNDDGTLPGATLHFCLTRTDTPDARSMYCALVQLYDSTSIPSQLKQRRMQDKQYTL